MTTTWANTAACGTNGTAVTLANSVCGGAFSAVFIVSGSSSTITFDNSHPANGTLSYKFSISSTASDKRAYLAWAIPTAERATPKARPGYLYLPSVPGVAFTPFRGVQADGSSRAWDVHFRNSDSKLDLVDSTGAVVGTTGAAIPIAAQVRVEVDVDHAAGSAVMRTYEGANANGTTPTQTVTVAAGGGDFSSATVTVQIGNCYNNNISGLSGVWISNPASGTTSPVGPYVSGEETGSTSTLVDSEAYFLEVIGVSGEYVALSGTGSGTSGADGAPGAAGADAFASGRASKWGMAAFTMPGWAATNAGSNGLTPGVPYLGKITLEQDVVSGTRTVWFFQSAAAAGTITSGLIQCLDAAGALLGSVSANQQSVWNASTGVRSATVGSFGGSKGDEIYVVLLAVGGTAGPKLYRSANSALQNVNLAGSGLVWSTNGSGQSSITARTVASNVAQAEAYFVGVS